MRNLKITKSIGGFTKEQVDKASESVGKEPQEKGQDVLVPPSKKDGAFSSFTQDQINKASRSSLDTPFKPSSTTVSNDPDFFKKFPFTYKVEGDNEELRAKLQPTSQKWRNGFLKGVAEIGLTGSETFVDLAMLMPAIWNRDLNMLVDNKANRSLDEAREYLKEILPNYQTKAEQDMSAVEKLGTANFWAESVLSGLGFSAGAMLGGLGVGAGLKGISKLAKAGLRSSLTAVNGAQKAANLMGSTGKVARGIDGFTYGLTLTASGTAESAIEARSGKDSFVQKATEDFIIENGRTPNEQETKQIEDTAVKLSNYRFSMNMPIVAGSNLIQFGKFLKGGDNVFTNIIRDGKRFKVSDVTKFDKAKSLIWNPLTEASQEGGQYIVENYLEDYYRNIIGRENVDKFNVGAKAFEDAIAATFGTTEGQEQMLVGFIVGALGLPGPARGKGGKFGVTMHGGVWDTFKTNEDPIAHGLVAQLNDYVESDNFQQMYKDFQVQTSNRSEFEKFASRVKTSIITDTYDNLLEDINELRNLDIDEFIKEFKGDKDIYTEDTRNAYVNHLITEARKLKSAYLSIESLYGDKHEHTKDILYNLTANIDGIQQVLNKIEQTQLQNNLNLVGLFSEKELADNIKLDEDTGSFTISEENTKKLSDKLNEFLTNFVSENVDNLTEELLGNISNEVKIYSELKKQNALYLKIYNDLIEGVDTGQKLADAAAKIHKENEAKEKAAKKEARDKEFESVKSILDKKVKDGNLTELDIEKAEKDFSEYKSEFSKYKEDFKRQQDNQRNKVAEEPLSQEELDAIIDEDERVYAKSSPKKYRSINKYLNNEDYVPLESLIDFEEKNFKRNMTSYEGSPHERFINKIKDIIANVPKQEGFSFGAKLVENKKIDIDKKRQEVRLAIQKAGQGEGGQFTVTLSDGTKENAVRISLVGNELSVGNKGVSVDLTIIEKIENPDGTVIYDAKLEESKKSESVDGKNLIFSKAVISDEQISDDNLSNDGGGINIYIPGFTPSEVKNKGTQIVLSKKYSETLKTLLSLKEGDELEISIDKSNNQYETPSDNIDEWIKSAPIQIKRNGVFIGYLNKLGRTSKEIGEDITGVHFELEPVLIDKLLETVEEDKLKSEDEQVIPRLKNQLNDVVNKGDILSITDELRDFVKLTTNGKDYVHLQKLLSYNVTDRSPIGEYEAALIRWKNIIDNDILNTQMLRKALGKQIKLKGESAKVNSKVKKLSVGSVQFARDKKGNPIYRKVTEVIATPQIGFVKPGTASTVLYDASKSDEILYDRFDEVDTRLVPFSVGKEYFQLDGANGDKVFVPLHRGKLGDNPKAMKQVRTLFDKVVKVLIAPEVNYVKLKELEDALRLYIPVNRDIKSENLYFKIHGNTGVIEYKAGDEIIKIFSKGEDKQPSKKLAIYVNDQLLTDEKAMDKVISSLEELNRNVDYHLIGQDIKDPVTGDYINYYNWLLSENVFYTDVADVVDNEGDKISNISVRGKYPMVLTIDSLSTTQKEVKEDKDTDVEDFKDDKKDLDDDTDDLFGDILMSAKADTHIGAYDKDYSLPDITALQIKANQDGVRTAKTHPELFENIINSAPTGWYSEIISTLANKDEIRFVIFKDMQFFENEATKEDGVKVYARYSLDLNTIFVNSQLFNKRFGDYFENVFPHEIGHQITAAAINTAEAVKSSIKNSSYVPTDRDKVFVKFYDDITKIYDKYIEQYPNDKYLYGGSIAEFVAEALGNKAIVEKLENTPFEGQKEDYTPLSKSVLGKIYTAIKDLLNKLYQLLSNNKTSEPIQDIWSLADQFQKVIKNNWEITAQHQRDITNPSFRGTSRFYNFAKREITKEQVRFTVPGFSVQEEAAVINSLTGFIADYNIKLRTLNQKQKTDTIFKGISKKSINVFNFKEYIPFRLKAKIEELNKELLTIEDANQQVAIAQQVLLLEKTIEDIETNDNDNSILGKVNRRLKKDLKYDLEDVEEYTSDDVEISRGWDGDTSMKKSLVSQIPDKIRELLYSIPKLDNVRKDEFGDLQYTVAKSSITGLMEYEDFRDTFNFIRDEIKHSIDSADMMRRFKSLLQIRPSLVHLYNILETNKDNVKDSFYTLFSQPEVDYDHILINTEGDNTIFKVGISNKRGYHKLADTWIENFKEKLFNKQFTDEQKSSINSLIKVLQSGKLPIDKQITSLKNVFDKLGFYIQENSIKLALQNSQESMKYLRDNFIQPLSNIINNSLIKNEFDDFKVINNVAKIIYKYEGFTSEAVFQNVNNETETSSRLPNFISSFNKLIENYVDGDKYSSKVLLETLQSYAHDPSFEYSNWLWNTEGRLGMLTTTNGIKDINNAKLNKPFFEYFSMYYHDGIKNRDNNKANKFTKQNNYDYGLINVVFYLQGLPHRKTDEVLIPALTFSDSNIRVDIKQKKIKLTRQEVFKNEEGVLSLAPNSLMYKAIRNIAMQEVVAMDAAAKFMFVTEERFGVERLKLDSDGNLIIRTENEQLFEKNYHYKIEKGKRIYQKEGKPVGNVFKFNHIPTLNTYSSLFIDGVVFRDLFEDLSFFEGVKEKIDQFITTEYNKMSKVNKPYLPKIKQLLDSYSGNVDLFNLEFVLNQFVSNVEYQNFFLGTTAIFKSGEDTVKRAKSPGSPGLQSTLENLGQFRKIAILKDIDTKSSVYKQMFDNTVKDLKEGGYTVAQAKALAKDLLSNYENITRTDGVGILPMATLEKFLKDIGRFDTYKYLFDKIKKGQDLKHSELKQIFTMMKLHQFDRYYSPENNRVISNQLKYAVLPAIPQLIKNNPSSGEETPLWKFLESIKVGEYNGLPTYKADEFVFESGVKFGAFYVNDVIDDAGKLNEENIKNLVTQTVPNKNWVLQQETPIDYEDYHGKLAVQIAKHILTNINNDTKYTVRGKEITGKELKDAFQDAVVSEIEFGKYLVDNELDITYDENGTIQPDLYRLIAFLKENGADKLSQNALLGLTLDEVTGEPLIPLDFNSTKDSFISSILSLWTNNVTNLKLSGFHSVVASDGMLYSTVNSDELKAEFVDGTFILEAWLPAWSKDFYKNGKIIPIEQLSEDLRTIISYRIPTSGKHSAVVIKVVGWLPAEIGPTMIVNKDAVARTGMDFDIDSLYAITATHYKKEDGSFDVIDSESKPTKDLIKEDYFKTREGREVAKYFKQSKKRLNDELDSIFKGKQISMSIYENRITKLIEGSEGIKDFLTGYFKPLREKRDEYITKRNELETEYNYYTALIQARESTGTDFSQEDVYSGRQAEEFATSMFSNDSLENYKQEVLEDLNKLNDDYFKSLQDELTKITKTLVITDKLKDQLDKTKLNQVKEIANQILAEKTKQDEKAKEYNLKIIDNRNELRDSEKYLDYRVDSVNLVRGKTSKQRQNQIRDLMLAVLTNPAHTTEIIEPAQFPETQNLAADIDSVYKEFDKINPVAPSDNYLARQRAISGKNNIGASASFSGTFAVLQTIGASYVTPITIKVNKDRIKLTQKALKEKLGEDNVVKDGEYFNLTFSRFGWNLDGTYTTIFNKKYSYITGLTVDHSADAVKEPLPANLNEITTNAFQSIVALTGDVEYAGWLINQPIIRRLVYEQYTNNNITNVEYIQESFNKVRSEYIKFLLDDYLKKGLKIDEKTKNKLIKQLNKDFIDFDTIQRLTDVNLKESKLFTLEELKAHALQYVGKKKTYERKEYLINQLILLNEFMKYDNIGSDFLKVANILSVDKIGAGPTTAKTYDILRNFENVRNKFFVGDLNIVEAVYPKFSGTDATNESVYPIMQAYLEHSNLTGLKYIESTFKTEGDFMNDITNIVYSQLDSSKTGNKDYIRKKVGQFFSTMLYRNNPKFQIDNLERNRILGITTLENTKTEYISFDDYIQLSTYDKLFVLRDILKIPANTTHLLNYLEPNTRKGLEIKGLKLKHIKDTIIEEQLTDSFIDMLYSNNEYEVSFAEDLIHMADMMYGFGTSIQSFAKIIPSAVLAKEYNISQGYNNFDNTSLNKEEIANMYLRNNPELLTLAETKYNSNGEVKSVGWFLNNDNLLIISQDAFKYIPKELKYKKLLRISNKNKNLSKRNDIIIERVLVGEDIVYRPISTLGNNLLIETSINSALDSNIINDNKSEQALNKLLPQKEGMKNYLSIKNSKVKKNPHWLKDEEMANASNKAIAKFTKSKSSTYKSSTKAYLEAIGGANIQFNPNDSVWVFGAGNWSSTENDINNDFNNYYKPTLDNAINSGVLEFNIGIASGVDTLVSNYLKSKGYIAITMNNWNKWVTNDYKVKIDKSGQLSLNFIDEVQDSEGEQRKKDC